MNKVAWYARPGIVLSLLGVLILLTVLFAKTPVNGRNGDPRLTTISTDPLGAKLFYQLAERMGFTVRRERRGAFPATSASPKAIVAVLDPTIALEPREVHALLEHARSGGALLLVLGARTRVLSDSLKISFEEIGGSVNSPLGKGTSCQQTVSFARDGLWLTGALLFRLKVPDSLSGMYATFLTVDGTTFRDGTPTSRFPAMIGLTYGTGRIVVASDPDVLRNDALRNCSYGLDLPAVAALHYLADTLGVNRRELVFDEYHQGNRLRAAPRGLVAQYLLETPSGNVILQICVSGLVLLLAAATRVLPPRHEAGIERRSPLEHVDALARAYAQVGATRTGALRLVRGLQRRTGGVRRASTRVADDAFLMRIADSVPSTKSDVAVVRNALATAVSAREFVEVGHAIARIEAALTTT